MDASTLTTGILRPDIELLRGDELMLFDPGADAYYKITPQMFKLITHLTEELPLPEFQQRLMANGIAVSLEELQETIMFLRQNNLLIPRYGEAAARQQQIKKLKEKNKVLHICSSYLFFRLPPWRPEKFFQKYRAFFNIFTSKLFLLALLLPAALGYLLVVKELHKVHAAFIDTLSWAGLVKYFWTIVFLKFIHEAAHSLAAIRFNCRVRGIGIGFMLLVPRLYTDTTDSWRLPPRQRLLIDGAGIIAELLLGGIAALFWLYLAPGAAKSTMLYIFAVSTLSTLLVNGNPLIRYDGYYILCDLLKTDNLMSRAAMVFRQSWRWYFLRLGAPSADPQRAFLLIFGSAAFIYKFFLYTSICLLIYYRFTKVAAMVMLAMEIYILLIHPCWKELKSLRALSGKSAWTAGKFMLAAAILLIAGIVFLPLSWSIELPGETVFEFRHPVTVEESGYLTATMPKSPRAVKASEALFSLHSPRLEYSLRQLHASIQYDQLLLELQKLDEKEFVRQNSTIQRLVTDTLGLAELKRRQKKLTVYSKNDGFFTPAITKELSAGAFLLRNSVIGTVHSGRIIINAYADDREIGKITPGMTGIATTGDALQKIPVRVKQIEKTAASFKSSPLLQNTGGTLPVYQNGNEFKPVQTLYKIELEAANGGSLPLFSGRTVSVKLTHTSQLYKTLSSFLLGFWRKEF